ncbi:hypothetical protein [Rubrivirga sp.]|uniref:hypothetical protein n=1 Tax=Rubrivirga sp. TaxID=1885344 RepID=UPI003B52F4D3
MTYRCAPPRSFALALTLLLSAAPALAQDLTTQAPDDDAPVRMTYSGLLTDAAGTPLADGAHGIVFRLYASPDDARDGAAPVWEEAHDAAVDGGRFLVLLGSKTALPGDGDWLTVEVDGEPASAPVRFGGAPTAAFAPGNTLQDSYDNGRFITVASGAPLQINGTLGQIGFITRDVTPVFISDELMRFRLRSVQGGSTWEYRVYGTLNPTRDPGTFAITEASGGGADGFVMEPGVSEDLMILSGQTVALGSPDNVAGLRAYTTPNPAGPGTGVVGFEVTDHFSAGGSSEWYTEDGASHTRVEPDFGGDGGYVEVARGSGGSALVVDGDTGGGSATRVGSGVRSSSFNDTAAGTGSVALPVSAIDAVEILDEAGTANQTNSSPVTLSAGFNTTLTRSVTAPAPGYVIAIATGEVGTSHTAGSTSNVQFAVSRSCASPSAPPVTQQQNTQIPASAPTGTYADIVSVHGLFEVGVGTTTFCNVVQLIGSTTGSIDDQNLTLLYVPTAYGAIASNLVDEPGGPEGDESAQAPLTAGDVEQERTASVQANEARIAAELEAIRARVAELEASMTNDG